MTVINIPDQEHLQFEVAKLELRPGDVLVARAPRALHSVEAARLRSYLERGVPNTRILVVDCGLELTVVSKAEGKRLAKDIA